MRFTKTLSYLIPGKSVFIIENWKPLAFETPQSTFRQFELQLIELYLSIEVCEVLFRTRFKETFVKIFAFKTLICNIKPNLKCRRVVAM